MSSHKRECDMENKFQDTASSKKKLRCEISMNSHNRKCNTCLFHIVNCQVGMKDNELSSKVAKVKQDLSNGKLLYKIPHKIYEHLQWINKLPEPQRRVVREVGVDPEIFGGGGSTLS